ncbi:hypothetical protein [Lacrimispora sp. 210928-DFI.3.58]|jgi:hypothetical protein|uniref:hypothetical protein n=1 Tax=Lacrimispora sp. 210928-DFI.3.58 TaxID=2883214 RepID=UPI001D08464E|nr:hypothetical protein [Lacrimispora sp. 210928-DFI.3.58]MCB7319107.1 hypothetical protein [Lacrimispora sp. 210928-DFI.3.58]
MFERRELLYIDLLVVGRLEYLKARHTRDKRIFDATQIDIHERLVRYEAEIMSLDSVHEKIVKAVGDMSL